MVHSLLSVLNKPSEAAGRPAKGSSSFSCLQRLLLLWEFRGEAAKQDTSAKAENKTPEALQKLL